MGDVGYGKPPVDGQFKPGVSGNPAGKPKGRRNLSTIIRDMLEDEIDWTLIPIKDPVAMETRYKEKSAWEALVAVAFSKALSGDTRAMTWLSKSGYGDKLVHEIPEDLFSATKMVTEVVRVENVDDNPPIQREAGTSEESD